MRSPYGHGGYGREQYHFDGNSLPSLLRSVRLFKLDGVKEQTPQVRYATPDRARLRAPECVRRWMRLMRRPA